MPFAGAINLENAMENMLTSHNQSNTDALFSTRDGALNETGF